MERHLLLIQLLRRHQARVKFTKARSIALIFLVLVGCNAPTGKNHYILAERLFNDHKYAAAVEEFKEIIESDPRSHLAQQSLFRIGVIQYLYLEQYQEAIKSFRQFAVVSQNKDLVYQAEKSIGELYFTKLEDYRQAIEQYKRLLEKYPDSKERDFFMLRVAKSHYGALEFDKAVQMYKEIAKQFPKTSWGPEALYQIGNTYYTKGDIDSAIETFQDVVLLFPKTQQALFAQFGIGNCYEERDKLDEALEIYSKILDKHPARNVVEAKIRRLKERMSRK